jgi:hypothetical protein
MKACELCSRVHNLVASTSKVRHSHVPEKGNNMVSRRVTSPQGQEEIAAVPPPYSPRCPVMIPSYERDTHQPQDTSLCVMSSSNPAPGHSVIIYGNPFLLFRQVEA